jgi:Fe-S oxidoreductase
MYGDLTYNEIKELHDVASYCINCKACQLDCPGNVSGGDLMLEIKAQAAKRLGLPFDVKALLKFEDMLYFGRRFAFISNLLSSLSLTKLFLDKTIGIAKERATPRLSRKRFTNSFRPALIEKPVEKVVYFIDTFADIVNTNVADSLVKVLEFNNVKVEIPKQLPSGIVDMNYGNLKKLKRKAQKNLELLLPYVKNGYKIVCSEPSAALMLKEEYYLLTGDKRFEELGGAVYDIMSLLLELDANSRLKKTFKRNDITCVYHKPCHLKVLSQRSAAVELLSMVPSLKIEELDEGCCGIAGTFGIRKKGYKDSLKIGEGLFKRLNATEILLGITDCTTCRMQMEHGANSKPVKHPIELLAESYQSLKR